MLHSCGCTHPCPLEEGFPGSLPACVACLLEVFGLDEGSSSEQHRLIQEQADLSTQAILRVNNAQEFIELQQRHIRVDIFNVGPEKSILKLQGGEGQCSLGMEILDIFRGNSGRQWLDESWKLSQQVRLFEGVEELGCA